MSKSSEAVKKWRRKTKHMMVESMGGCCQICGYNRCLNALEFHHIDPNEKDISFGKVTANPTKREKLKEELKKCILLCSCCHKEVHEGMTKMPTEYFKFNESIFNDLNTTHKKQNPCPVCGGEKFDKYKTCSRSCSAKLGYKVDWDNNDLQKLLIENDNNYSKVAELLNCSEGAVHKRAKKLGIK